MLEADTITPLRYQARHSSLRKHVLVEAAQLHPAASPTQTRGVAPWIQSGSSPRQVAFCAELIPLLHQLLAPACHMMRGGLLLFLGGGTREVGEISCWGMTRAASVSGSDSLHCLRCLWTFPCPHRNTSSKQQKVSLVEYRMQGVYTVHIPE